METGTTSTNTARIIDFERIRQLIPEKGSIQFILKMDGEKMRVMFVRKGDDKKEKSVTTLTLTATPSELNDGFDEKIIELSETKYKTLDQVFKEQAAAVDKKIEDAKKKPTTTSTTMKKTPPAVAAKQPVKVIEHKKPATSGDLFSGTAEPSQGSPEKASATAEDQSQKAIETDAVDSEVEGEAAENDEATEGTMEEPGADESGSEELIEKAA